MEKHLELLRQYHKSLQIKGAKEKHTAEEIMKTLGPVAFLPQTIVYLYNHRTGKVEFSYGFEKVLGYPEDTVIDLNFILDIVHPDDAPAMQYLAYLATKYHHEIDEGKPYETTADSCYRIRKYDGSYVMILKRSTGFQNDENGAVSHISILQQIDFMNVSPRVRGRSLSNAKTEAEYHEKAAKFIGQDKIENLSIRESQVLRFIAQGYTSTEIAERLFLSKHTVDNHRKNMLRKTGLKNTSELIRYGLENGLL